jgi:hypothetical protein
VELVLPLALLALVALLIGAVLSSLFQRTIVYDYQRGLRYRDGRFTDLVGPGSHWAFAPTTTIKLVDLRSGVLPLPGQELVTSDGVTIKVSLAVQRRLVDPVIAINEVENYTASTYSILQVALRETVGAMPVDDVLTRRTEIGPEVLRRKPSGRSGSKWNRSMSRTSCCRPRPRGSSARSWTRVNAAWPHSRRLAAKRRLSAPWQTRPGWSRRALRCFNSGCCNSSIRRRATPSCWVCHQARRRCRCGRSMLGQKRLRSRRPHPTPSSPRRRMDGDPWPITRSRPT